MDYHHAFRPRDESIAWRQSVRVGESDKCVPASRVTPTTSFAVGDGQLAARLGKAPQIYAGILGRRLVELIWVNLCQSVDRSLRSP